MKINWKLKSLIFRTVDIFELNQTLYYVQKNITRNAQVNIKEIKNDWKYHSENLLAIKNKKIIEFGAGKSLEQNIFFSNFFAEQTLVDINNMLDYDLINSAISQISSIEEGISKYKICNLNDLYRYYKIKYLSPVDLTEPNTFKENAFDGCISTNTLEHISKEDLYKIFNNLHAT